MKLYRCLMLGENFPGAILGYEGPIGFFTTRFVRAENAEEAEAEALRLLRDDQRLDVETSKRRVDARVFFEAVEEIDGLPEGVEEPGGGYSFFRMGT